MKKGLLIVFSLASLTLLPACMPFAKNCGSGCSWCSKGKGGSCENKAHRHDENGKVMSRKDKEMNRQEMNRKSVNKG